MSVHKQTGSIGALFVAALGEDEAPAGSGVQKLRKRLGSKWGREPENFLKSAAENYLMQVQEDQKLPENQQAFCRIGDHSHQTKKCKVSTHLLLV